MTALDEAHAEMEAAPGDEGARRRWYGRLLDAELVLVLDREGGPQDLRPRLFALDDGPTVLAYEGEARLATAIGGPVACAAMPGRALVAALAGQGAGLGVNLGAEAPFLMQAEAVDWLAAVLATPPRLQPAGAAGYAAAPDLPPRLHAELRHRLAAAAGLAEAAWLVALDGRPTVVFAGARAGEPLARMVAEAAAFAGEGRELDTALVPPGAAVPEAALRLGRPLALPAPPAPEPPAPPAPPGPPRLRRMG